MDENMSFETALARLNEITNLMQRSDTSLDDSLKLFEEGIKLSKYCSEKLQGYQDRLNSLTSQIEAKND